MVPLFLSVCGSPDDSTADFLVQAQCSRYLHTTTLAHKVEVNFIYFAVTVLVQASILRKRTQRSAWTPCGRVRLTSDTGRKDASSTHVDRFYKCVVWSDQPLYVNIIGWNMRLFSYGLTQLTVVLCSSK